MSVQQNVRIYGSPKGAAGLRIVERQGVQAMSDPRYGTVFYLGPLKRGPMGVPIPFSTYSDYQNICGDPRDSTWHLYRDGSQLLPDTIDGYYFTGGGAGQMWLIRLDLDGKAKRASKTFKNSVGADALRIEAANEGRWGGKAAKLASRPIIYATANTFTLVAPGVAANEFVDAEVSFDDNSGKTYIVTSNTEAGDNGEVVFSIGPQYSLIADGITGPTTLTGTASYERYVDLTGTIDFDLTKDLTGTANVNERVITGVGTAFMDELEVGQNVYFNGEARAVESITSDTTLTIAEPFTAAIASGVTLSTDNREVTGTLTTFLTDLAVGQTIYTMINGELQGRTVEAIATDTSLTLSSGFTTALTAATVSKENLILTGVTTQFTTELQAGSSYIVDPNRAGNAVRVLAINSATEIELEEPFAFDFADAQLTKQSLSAEVNLAQVGNEGLSVEIGQGTKYPATHFSLNVYFNGSLVFQAPDCSLDPNDVRGLFVESVVNDDGNNVAYRTGSTNFNRWITATSLWNSTYTTNPDADVRPTNGTGKVLALTQTRLYTAASFDYAGAVGNLLYPNPYQVARSYVRVQAAVAPVTLQGTISTSGVNVTGTSTNFLTSLAPGDYLYDAVSGTARKVRSVLSDTSATLETAFPANLPALTTPVKAGYLESSQGYDLRAMTQVGQRFMMNFPEPLSGGYDGNLGGIIPYYYTKYADLDANIIENAVWGKNLGLIRIACPGVSDEVVQKAFAFYAEQKAFEFRAEIPSNYTSAATAEVFLNQMLGRNDFQSLAFPSYGFISSPFARQGDRLISLSGEIMGGESAAANVAEGYHKPFAGTNAVMPRIIKLPVDLKPQDEAVLNLTGIQPIKFMYGNCVVFGARNTAISPLYDFLHIRRTQTNYIRVFLESRELLEQLFKPNQPETEENVIMVLNNWARKEYQKGVFAKALTFQQAVEIQGSNLGTGVITDDSQAVGLVETINGKLKIYVAYVPAGIVEELVVNIGPDILTAQYGNSLSGSML